RWGPGMQYAEQRYYNPQMGKFFSPDPTRISTGDPANPVTWALYGYAAGDAINLIDPTGRVISDPGCGDPSYPCGDPCDPGFTKVRELDPGCPIDPPGPPPVRPTPPPPPPPPPACILSLDYRGLDFPVVGLVATHTYLDFWSPATGDIIIEGYTDPQL